MRFHIHVSIRGALAMSPREFAKNYRGVFSRDDGSPMPPSEARAALEEELALGHEIIPAQGCNHFDWKRGCLGHSDHDDGDQERAK